MPLFLVETIATFRHRYVIDAECLEHAYDTVCAEEANDFSQKYLGEQILGGRKISRKKFEKLSKSLEANGDGTVGMPEVGSPWMGDKQIHVVNYGDTDESKNLL